MPDGKMYISSEHGSRFDMGGDGEMAMYHRPDGVIVLVQPMLKTAR